MNEKFKRITTKKDFDAAWQLINKIFYVSQEMPNQVFKKPFSGFVFEEFDWAMSGEFWEFFLNPVGAVLQDAYILTTVLNPHPKSCIYSHFDYYDMIKFPISISRKDYWNALETGPENDSVNAMLFYSEIVAWVPSSGKWAIWGERSYEICVLAFADDRIKQAVQPFLSTWKMADKALNRYISERVSQSFKDSLVKNYLK